MRRLATILAAMILAGGLRPGVRCDCARPMPERAAAPAVSCPMCGAGHGMAAHAAPAKKDCSGMICCSVKDARISLEASSAVPRLAEVESAASATRIEIAPAGGLAAASPAPPGPDAISRGFSSSASLRGPPVLA